MTDMPQLPETAGDDDYTRGYIDGLVDADVLPGRPTPWQALALLTVLVAIIAFVFGYTAGSADAASRAGQEPPPPAQLEAPSPTVWRTARSEQSAPAPSAWTREGIASTYGPGYDGLTASPWPRGTLLEICGPAACRIRKTNDVGPDQVIHPDRVVDLDVATFETVCDVGWRMGLCPVVVTVIRRG